jgi:diguanylate cyclase (GGDEF)-like protein
VTPPDTYRGLWQTVLAGKEWRGELQNRRKTGELYWESQHISPVLDGKGKIVHFIAVKDDVTAQKRAEERIRRLNRVYAMLSGINALIVRVRERDELFREACRIAVESGGFRMAWLGLVERDAMRVKPGAWYGTGVEYIELMPLRLDESEVTLRGLVRPAVSERRPMISSDMTRDPRISLQKEALERGFRSLVMLPLLVGGGAAGVLAFYAGESDFFDEEEMKLLTELAGDIAFALDAIEKREKLDYLAFYDQLTGLANRSLYLERVTQSIRTIGPAGGKFALALLDTERLRSVNESLGRAAGDELLKQVAARLVAVGGPSAAGRIVADHFALTLGEVKGRSEATRYLAAALHSCFARPFKVGDEELRLAAKAGAVLFPDDGADAETLLGNAEVALRKAKQLGESRIFYTADLTEQKAHSLSLETKLRQALEREEFVLHYQPKVDIETRRILGVEALIRWQSPELGLVPPLKFIPLMEETGLILHVGDWALRQAVRDRALWLGQGLAAPRIAVNVSAIQLRRREFLATLREALGQCAAPVGIDLEITESLVMENIQGNIAKLRAIRDLGVEIAIDDFGTGYSSLAYLAKLPVQILKIDRSFISGMLKDADTMTLVSTMISLAHSLRLKVVGEGVEEQEQAKMLRLLRCDQMQGYLISRPVPFEAMTHRLKQA